MKNLIHQTDPRSDLYCPGRLPLNIENVRFDKDFCQYERKRREDEIRKKEETLENKRATYLQRETDKWNRMDNDFNHCQEILDNKKRTQTEAGTYSNGMAFNPITLEYHTGSQGDRLRARDEDSQLRGKLRAKNLDMRANTNYNILTGENRKGINVPKDVFQRYAEHFVLPSKKVNNIW